MLVYLLDSSCCMRGAWQCVSCCFLSVRFSFGSSTIRVDTYVSIPTSICLAAHTSHIEYVHISTKTIPVSDKSRQERERQTQRDREKGKRKVAWIDASLLHAYTQFKIQHG